MDQGEGFEYGENIGYFPDPNWTYTGLSAWEASMHRRMRFPLELRIERLRLKRNLETDIDPILKLNLKEWFPPSHAVVPTDVVIETPFQDFKVHKFVFRSISDFFKNTFKHNPSTTIRLLPLESPMFPDEDLMELFPKIRDYAYTGTTDLTLDNVQQMVALTDNLCIDKLRDRCCELMAVHLDQLQSFKAIQFAESMNLVNLKAYAQKLFCRHLLKLSERLDYSHMDHDSLQILSYAMDLALMVTPSEAGPSDREYNLFTDVMGALSFGGHADMDMARNFLITVRLLDLKLTNVPTLWKSYNLLNNGLHIDQPDMELLIEIVVDRCRASRGTELTDTTDVVDIDGSDVDDILDEDGLDVDAELDIGEETGVAGGLGVAGLSVAAGLDRAEALPLQPDIAPHFERAYVNSLGIVKFERTDFVEYDMEIMFIEVAIRDMRGCDIVDGMSVGYRHPYTKQYITTHYSGMGRPLKRIHRIALYDNERIVRVFYWTKRPYFYTLGFWTSSGRILGPFGSMTCSLFTLKKPKCANSYLHDLEWVSSWHVGSYMSCLGVQWLCNKA